jgi:hypothetical protein
MPWLAPSDRQRDEPHTHRRLLMAPEIISLSDIFVSPLKDM